MAAALKGIRVLDLTSVLAGPFCCHHLAHLGAEVIKVEAPGRGDLARQLGADPALNAGLMGASFLAQNAGKKSVTVNFKHPCGKALFLELVDTADVVVENFRPGVMDRLGLGYAALKARRPEIIYCAISGFGQSGPWRDRPAYDQIIQGASGLMSVTGDAGTAPLRTGFPVADTVGGLTAAFAVAAALNAEPRGCFLDVSMMAALMTAMGWVVSNHMIAGQEPAAHGNENPTAAPSGTFQTADGPINIAANKQEQWVALTDHLGLDALQEHPDFAEREARLANRIALKTALEAVLVTRPAAAWEAELTARGVPASAVLRVPEALAAPPIAERDMIARYAHVPGVDRAIAVASTGITVDGVPPKVADPPPSLNQHAVEVWGALGLTRADIEALQAEGAL